MNIKEKIHQYNTEVDNLIEELSQLKVTDNKFSSLLDIMDRIQALRKRLNKRIIEKSFCEIYGAVTKENFEYRVAHDPNFISIIER